MPPERVAIVGARAHPDLDQVRAYVAALPDDAWVISGGAMGVDQAAEEAALKRGLGVASYRVVQVDKGYKTERIEVRELVSPSHRGDHRSWILPWKTSYRDALIFRNTFIALTCTRMVAFPAGSRGGTKDAVAQAERFRRPVGVIW